MLDYITSVHIFLIFLIFVTNLKEPVPHGPDSALSSVFRQHMLTNQNQSENPQGGDSGNTLNQKLKIIQLPEDSCLNQQIIEELEVLFQFSSPKEISRYLRDVFLLSLIDENHNMLQDLQRKAENFFFLFKFLDLAEDEMGIREE